MSEVNFDFDLLNELVNEAPMAGYGPQRNFGLMKVTLTVITWKDGKATEVPFTNQKLDNGGNLRLNFQSDLSEFNPALVNPYKRRVDIRKSGPRSKTDFSETVEPSSIKVIGKEWLKKLTKGVYCEWEDAETVEVNRQGELKGWTNQETGKVYINSIPRFLRVFKSKAECDSARTERFNRGSNSNGSIPAEVVGQVKGLITALKNDMEQVRETLEDKPFGDYEVDALLTAAGVTE